MTEQERIEKAKERIRAERAAYQREWRKKNPDKVKIIRKRYEMNKIKRYAEEIEANEN